MKAKKTPAERASFSQRELSAFLESARLDRVEEIKAALSKSPELASGRGAFKKTALMVAAEAGSLGALRELIPHSDASAACWRGDTALMLAAMGTTTRAMKCVELLLPVSGVVAVGDARGWGDPAAVEMIQRHADALREKEALEAEASPAASRSGPRRV